MKTTAIQLLVDRNDADPCCVSFIYQREPHPGGHDYELRIPRDMIDDEVQSYASFEASRNPEEKQVRDWMFWLGHVVSRACDPEDCNGDSYVINNILLLECDTYSFVVRGQCSPWISGSS